MSKQTITRKGTFDSMHRVMNERMKCFNVHGHTYLFELTFGFSQMEDIGYAIDFKEVKRVGCQWIDDILDHGAILNPKDAVLIDAVNSVDSKLYKMSLNGGEEYCNPSVENLVKEIFMLNLFCLHRIRAYGLIILGCMRLLIVLLIVVWILFQRLSVKIFMTIKDH